MEKAYLTVREASTYIGMKQSYLYKLTASHRIPCYAPTGKRLYFKKSELDDWMCKRRISTNCELASMAQESLV